MSNREKYLSKEVKASIETAKVRGYHNPEVADIEDAMRDVVIKLKSKIDAGTYDTLISDDVGGRIPTLILRKVINEISPEKVETYFVPAGKYLKLKMSEGEQGVPEKQESMLVEELSKIKPKKKVLVVTQLSHSGETVDNMRYLLESAGVDREDIEFVVLSGFLKDSDDTAVGDHATGMFAEMHDPVSGVSKAEQDDGTTKLVRRTTHLKDRGLDSEVTSDYLLWEQYRNFFGLKRAWGGRTLGPDEALKKQQNPKKLRKYKQKMRRPLTDKQVDELKNRVATAREDVKTMADRLINEIWGKEQKRKEA